MRKAKPDFVTNFDTSPLSKAPLPEEAKRDYWREDGKKTEEAAEQYYQRRTHSSGSSSAAAPSAKRPSISSSASSRISSSSSRVAKERPQFITKFDNESSPSIDRGRMGAGEPDDISEVSSVGAGDSGAYSDSFYGRKKTTSTTGPGSTNRGVVSAGQGPPDAISTSSLPKDYAALLEGYRVLQYQNTLLTKQLQQLHTAVVVRERCENKVALLLADLISSIEEIAGIAKGVGGREEKESPSSSSLFHQRGVASSTSTSMAVWTTVLRSLQELQSQWRQGVRDGRVAVLNSVKIHPKSSNFVTLKGSNSSRSRPSTIRLNQILGISSLNISFLSDACDLNSDADSYLNHDYQSDVGKVGLDVGRICTLQTDLVSFANEAYDLLQQMPQTDSRRAALERMKQSCEALLIHLASLSPVAPLEACPPLKSTASGLDNLIGISEQILKQSPKAGKGMTTAWQAAVDRARVEQLAVVRVLTQARQRLGES